MKLLGITGGAGMGKSAVGQLLALCRVPVLDTDWVARQVVEPGQPALAQVAAAFGPGVLDGAGALRRDRSMVFGKPESGISKRRQPRAGMSNR